MCICVYVCLSDHIFAMFHVYKIKFLHMFHMFIYEKGASGAVVPKGVKNVNRNKENQSTPQSSTTAVRPTTAMPTRPPAMQSVRPAAPMFFPPLKRTGPPRYNVTQCKPTDSKFQFQFHLPELSKPISACNFCGSLASRTKKCFASASVYAHVMSGDCDFLKKNYPPGYHFECEVCDFKVGDQKNKNIAILNHIKNYHPELKQHCIYCNDLLPIGDFPTHLWNESKNVFKLGINCKRCYEQFYTVHSYYDHLCRHDAGRPNVNTFRRCVPDDFTNYHLIILGLFVYKHLTQTLE